MKINKIYLGGEGGLSLKKIIFIENVTNINIYSVNTKLKISAFELLFSVTNIAGNIIPKVGLKVIDNPNKTLICPLYYLYINKNCK